MVQHYRLAGWWLFGCLLGGFSNVDAVYGQKDESIQNVGELQKLEMTDVHGKVFRPFENEKLEACVLVFVSPDCPIANTLQPELKAIHQRYQKAAVQFYLVYCAPELDVSSCRQHVEDYSVEMPAIMDRGQRLGLQTGAKVTPEVVMVKRDGQVAYRGMINNLYVGYGKKRRSATEHYLNDACAAILEGKQPPVTATKPIGCFIYYPPEVEKRNEVK